MNVLRLTLSLAVCVPGLALLGAIAAADTYFPAWEGHSSAALSNLLASSWDGRCLTKERRAVQLFSRHAGIIRGLLRRERHERDDTHAGTLAPRVGRA